MSLDPQKIIAGSSESRAAASLAPATSHAKLDRSLAGSLAWRAIADWSSQIFTWAVFLTVARLLKPEDYGIVSMGWILLGYLRYVGEFGIPTTVVTLRDLTEHQIAQLNSVAVLLGVASFGISCALAYSLALFFRTPRLFPVAVVCCLALITSGVRAVPEGLLEKELRFRWQSLVNGGCDILAAGITLVLAFAGFAYWALVLGTLLAGAARGALIVAARPFRFAFPQFGSIRRQLLFGWHIMVSVLARSAYERLDNVMAGRVLGATALGFYGMAWSLANVPLEKVTTMVTTIIPSYLATVQSESAALRRYLRVLTELVALATFPTTIGLGLVAPELVPFALGRKWSPMTPALQVLCLYVAFRSLSALLDKVLTAVRKPRFVMWAQLGGLVVLPCAFYAGSHWGIAGIAWGWVAAYPLVALPLYWKTFQMIDMKFAEYFRSLRPALDSTLVMILAVEILRRILPSSQPLLLRLILEITAGAAVYISTVLLLHRERGLAFLNMAKSFVAGRRERQVAPGR
jgi:PST family polysaccharide transporter